MALGVISVMMASVSTYFVSSIKVGRSQSHVQEATRLAQAGMEQARGYGGAALLAGRAQCGSCLNLNGYDGGYLSNTVRWDAPGTGSPTVPYDSTPETFVIGGVTYYRYWFVGKCWQPAAGGTCVATAQTVPMVRLVVGVVWLETGCTATLCVRASSALLSADPADPAFP